MRRPSVQQAAPPVRLDEKVNLSVNEFCQVFGVKRTTAAKMIQSGELKSFKIGARRLIPKAAVDDLVARRLAEAR